MIKIDHSACLALGGTFDPCYILTLTTVPSQMGPTVNKRNAALIQSFMADILSVPSDRGILKFQPIEECNYAMNGTTMQSEIERVEKHQGDDGTGNAVRRAITNASRRSMTGFDKKSLPKLDTDVKTPNGAPATAPVVNGGRKSTDNRRNSQVSPPLTSAIPNVYELSAVSGDERPSTSHGASYAAENGLRMNGISNEDLSKTSNGRPKTIAGSEPMPKPPTRTSSQQKQRSRTSVKTEQKAANIPISPKPKQQVSERPKSGPPPKTKDIYLDNVTTVSLQKAGQIFDTKLDARAAEKNRQLDSKDNAANTARRRSTVTATPKMLPPPPVPESKTLPKVGKRKSFLSAFRKSTST
jgi:hypothetical protein